MCPGLYPFKSLKGWRQDNTDHIREQLTEELLAGDDRRVLFIGIDAYEKAGGQVRRDFFGEDVFLEQPEILQQLEAALRGIWYSPDVIGG